MGLMIVISHFSVCMRENIYIYKEREKKDRFLNSLSHVSQSGIFNANDKKF